MPDELEKLLSQLMTELAALRVESASILQALEDEATVVQRVGVRVPAQVGDRFILLKVKDICFVTPNEDGLTVYAADGNEYTNFNSLAITATMPQAGAFTP